MPADIIYNSRDLKYKNPYGAVETGTELSISLLVKRCVGDCSVDLVLLYDRDESCAVYEMIEVDNPSSSVYAEYSVSLTLDKVGLYWYWFETCKDGQKRRVGRGQADNRAYFDIDVSWQLTVYKRKYEVPEWIEGGVFYQIFVDRFCSEGERHSIEGKIDRYDWGGVPEFREKGGRIYNNDFFGGNLRGIIKKLPYLSDLGVTCIYLSPIFEAYSNHKYDTGDYMKIDSMFGNEAIFGELCEKAFGFGIRVICDGVFAHTGSDSVYFNKYGKYGSDGAYGNEKSQYRHWYYFEPDGSYRTWWGIDTLPLVNKSEPSYIKFITGEEGVVRHWLRAGASGWRLDVADELPGEFLERLAGAAKDEKSDSILVGEVWEDASKKIAYGERKNYFDGDKLDSVTNYPFKNAIIDFVKNGNAKALAITVEDITENYPSDVLHCLMNILGTHDSVRIITALAGEDLENESREAMAEKKLSGDERERGIMMLKVAAAIQMTLPGVPCIYYGDECGMEGYKDPFNRGCYPWGYENYELQSWYKKLISIRADHEVYKRGGYRTVEANESLYAFSRFDDGDDIITVSNCGEQDREFYIGGSHVDLISGRKAEGILTVLPYEVVIIKKLK